MGKPYQWNKEKNQKLIEERSISFEVVVAHLEAEGFVAIGAGRGRFKHQQQFFVAINRYIYVVPYVEDEKKVFLKTIIPSRKWTRYYFERGESK